MDIAKINISKNNLHSEDYVGYRIIKDKFCIIMNSDGNGTMGLQSCNDIYEFENGNLYLGSTIAITTDYFSNYLINLLSKDIENNGLQLESIFNILRKVIKDISIEKNNTCFCIKITIFDLHNKKMYCYNVGDCGHTLVNLDKEKLELLRNPLSYGTKLSFNGRGTGIIKIPHTLNNQESINKQHFDFNIYDLPNNFVFIQYSDGLDYDIAIPLQKIETKLKRIIDFTIDDFEDIEIMKHHHILNEQELNKDKPDTQYCKYNLTRNELKQLIKKDIKSKELITDIIRLVSNTPPSRRKIDDISLCVFKYIIR